MNAPATTRRPADVYRFEAAVRRLAWTWLTERIAALVARYRAQQTVRELAVLDDRELRDVGLLRADIVQAAKTASARG
ncbi:MAG TPA: DUF1127 domain-containing protein [Burkholderiales bacterium]|jgi:uncharacterized protein YjiS (DUF1127 family)|nr:DUF1127 domain-containing protein [Burkholderiales bacterium]